MKSHTNGQVQAVLSSNENVSIPPRKSVLLKIIILVILGLLLEATFFYFYIQIDLSSFSKEQATQSKEFIYQEEKTKLQDLVTMAYSVVESYYQQTQDIEHLKATEAEKLKKIIDSVYTLAQEYYREHKDEMPREQLLEDIKNLVAAVRYDGGNYIWINDTTSKMVMHPINPKLNGQDLTDFADPQGTRLFAEMVKVSKEKGEGMVAYLWPKPGATEPTAKVSYVKLLPELGWILGTGSWVADLTNEMKAKALEQLSEMRLEDGNYFWVTDVSPTMVMHPTNPQLDGKDLSAIKDPRGTALFVEMAEIAKKEGEGVVDYYWGKPGEQGDFPKRSYVKLFKPWGWVIGMGLYMDEVDAIVANNQQDFMDSINSLLQRALLAMGVFVLVVIGILVVFIRRDLNTPLRSLVAYSGDIASGNLDVAIQGRFKGEILRLKESLQSMVASLQAKMQEADDKSREAAAEAELARKATAEADEARQQAEKAKREGMLEAAGTLQDIISRLSSSSEELSIQVEEINRGTETQKQRISETATAMEQMTATVLEVARNAADSAENADATMQEAHNGAEVVERSIKAISSVHDLAMTLKTDMDELGQQAEAIGQIMNVINDIADQTNLLALNAAIEAARAGEAGRGFAVVADEVRKLAEKTMAATKEVGNSISAIQNATRNNTESVERAVEVVIQATDLAGKSGESLQQILRLSESTADKVRSIATASEEQSAASEEINNAIEEVNGIATITAESMGESTLALQTLSEQAGDLQELILRMQRENS